MAADIIDIKQAIARIEDRLSENDRILKSLQEHLEEHTSCLVAAKQQPLVNVRTDQSQVHN